MDGAQPGDDEAAKTLRVLHAVDGYVTLGLPDGAEAELARLPDELPTLELTQERWRLRVEVLRLRGEWEPMRQMSLACRDAWPQAWWWWTSLAYATRRCPPDLSGTVEVPHPERLPTVEAWAILRDAERRFPTEALLLHNLANYCRELDWRYEAAAYVRRLVRLDVRWRASVRADRDLAPLLGGLEPET